MTTTLEGSTALVTGATAGIGRAVALQLGQLGAEVVVHGRSAGVELLTRVWADEFGRSGVRVNAVQPGPAETPGTDATPGLADGFAAYTALGRVAAPDEIANAITFLASPAASYVNGAILQVTGGQLAIGGKPPRTRERRPPWQQR